MIHSYIGATCELENILASYKTKKILLVTGKSSYEKCGAKALIESFIEKFEVHHFSNFSVNPKIPDAIEGAKIATSNKIDLIVSVGGGSVIDMAKIVKALINQVDHAKDIATSKCKFQYIDIPHVCIPTTAGSGSEATHFAVVYVDKKKYSLADSNLKPDNVILDGNLVLTATKYQKACNVLDVISQSIESAWAVGATEESIKISFDALKLSLKHFSCYVNKNESNIDSAQKMLEASNLAGQAINVAKTTAAHAWSYGLTTKHNVPHGHAVWATLPKIFKIHASIDKLQINDKRGINHLSRIMIELNSILSIPNKLDIDEFFIDFLSSIDIKADLVNDFHLNENERTELLNSLNLGRMSDNPVNLSKKHCKEIFYLN